MIVGLGSDLVRIDRLEKALLRFGDGFARRVFTDGERQLCDARKNRAACYAKRFAAKEALTKALGTGMRGGIWFQDVEVLNDDLGRPVMTVSGAARERMQHLGAETTHVSLSDEGGFALAFVVLERQGDQRR